MRRTLGWVVVLTCLLGIFFIPGCSKAEFVEEGKDFLWIVLYIAIGIVSLALVIGAWSFNKAAGVIVTILVIVGLGTWYCLTRYSEPPENQPHAQIKFLIHSDRGSFSIRVDGRGMGFAGKTQRFHPGFFSNNQDGQYDVRVTPGSHEISVGWSYEAGTYSEETKKDLKYSLQVEAGATRYILLQNSPMGVSMRELTKAGYRRYQVYLTKSPDGRGAPPTSLPENLARAHAMALIQGLPAMRNLSPEQKRLLIEHLMKASMDKGAEKEKLSEAERLLKRLSEQE